MNRYSIYVTDFDYASLKEEEAVISTIDAALIPLQCRTESELIAQAKDADALIVQYAPITEGVFQALKKLKVIARYGVGVDSIDLDSAARHGVVVANVPDYGVAEVSDHTLTLLLNVLRKVSFLNSQVKNGIWDVKKAVPLRRLSTLTLGLTGCGRIGAETARKARAFGFRVIAADPFMDPDLIAQQDIEHVDFDTLLSQSDAISLHAPLTEDTYHLFNRESFRKMKKGSVLINTARGGLVDQNALVEALENGQLAGAGIDVCEVEPLEKDSPLRKFPHVVLTPHAAWYSEEAKTDLKRRAAEEVVRVLRGEEALHPVFKIPASGGKNHG